MAESKELPPGIRPFELELPIGYRLDKPGQLMTLQDLIDKPTEHRPGPYSLRERQELAVGRLQRWTIQIAVPGYGVLDKADAIKHVREFTPLGRELIEIQDRCVEYIFAQLNLR